jgi:hypothetical protein
MTAPRFSSDQHVKAAYAAHCAGDFYPPADVAATQKAQRDLVQRTWKADRDMTRRERRLYDHYAAALDAYDDERTAKYLRD